METTYVTTALSDFFTKYRIVRTHVARLLSQTNNQVLNRWISGSDIYMSSLLKIVNAYDMDLLSFFKLGNHTFTTTLHDLVKFEEAGLNLTDIMRERGIKTADVKKYRSLTNYDTISMTTVPAKPNDLKTKETPDDTEQQQTPTMVSADILDKVVQLQTSAFAHEQEALNRQHRDMQAIIDRQDAQITALQKELKRYQRKDSGGIRLGMIMDDSEVEGKREE